MSDNDGFLSAGQRAFLRGDHDPPSDVAERQTRQRIRDRTKAAIQDLGLVARSRRLDARDRATILARETPDETDESSAMVEVVRGDDGERMLRYPGTGEGDVVARIPHPVDPDPADPPQTVSTPDEEALTDLAAALWPGGDAETRAATVEALWSGAGEGDTESIDGLWGRVGVATEMTSILEFFYRMLREDGATREEVCSLIAVALEHAEGKHHHSSPIGWRHNDVAATVEVKTVDVIDTENDVDTEDARQWFGDGEDLSPLELKALVESGEYELQLTEE